MRLSKQEIEFFSDPLSLVVPIFVIIVYTLPTVGLIIATILRGSFIEDFTNGLWSMLLWGGIATWYGVYFIRVFLVARKSKG